MTLLDGLVGEGYVIFVLTLQYQTKDIAFQSIDIDDATLQKLDSLLDS